MAGSPLRLPAHGQRRSYLHTTTRGKFAVWDELLRDLNLRGSETVLDMGGGRGTVVLMATRLLPDGRAIGIDLWRTAEQSGNDPEVTRRNANLAGVDGRVELRTGDMRAMPFAGASADVVLSSLAIHNMRTWRAAGRRSTRRSGSTGLAAGS